MICPVSGSCSKCGHFENKHLEYIRTLEKAGFTIWAISARTKLKNKELYYCPEVELKLADINIF